MDYKDIKPAKFLFRPNRFIADIEIDGRVERCHVKNTGRCRELLIPGTSIFVQEMNDANRKTRYDLISVQKGNRLINIDSQAPNGLFYEWLQKCKRFDKIKFIKPEVQYRGSRFDFYVETDQDRIFVEVKGVTLEENDVALFPDAPTERGLKHVRELCRSLLDGYKAYVVFIIQMGSIRYFLPNYKTHPAFGEALQIAKARGVNLLAVDCKVGENNITVHNSVEIRL